jgi:hypothetical protein
MGSKTNNQCKQTNNSHAATLSCTFAVDKHNTTTPKGGAKPSPIQHQKKHCLAVINNTVKCPQSDMVMFWLYNPKINMSNFFPRDLSQKGGILFCCRGREFNNETETACPFLHPHLPEDLKPETMELIGDHFMAKKIGWFNDSIAFGNFSLA